MICFCTKFRMKLHIHQKRNQKAFASTRKFATSVALLENPLNVIDKAEKPRFQLDPVGAFTAWTKLANFTIKQIKSLHAHSMKASILQSEVFIANSLLSWYCKVSAINDAVCLFDEVPNPNVISWNILISGHNRNFMFHDSWRYFCHMHAAGFYPNQFTFGSVLSACSALRCTFSAKAFYSMSIKNGLCSDGYVRSGLIDMFSSSSNLDDALKVFGDCPDDENVVCWNTLISGAVKCGDNQTALEMLSRMCCHSVPNSFTFSSALTACTATENIDCGKVIHAMIVKVGAKNDVFVGTSLVDFYAKCRHVDDAIKEFLSMTFRNVVSWSALISGLVQMDESISALCMFREMKRSGEKANEYTLTSIITAISKLSETVVASQIHSCTIKTGFLMVSEVRAALVSMYSKVGEVCSSEKLFFEAENVQDSCLFASMMVAFCHSQRLEKATTLFRSMLRSGLKLDAFSTSSFLSVIDCLGLGRQIHSHMLKTGLVYDVSAGSALFTMYSKCWSLEESYKVFEQIPQKDIISWGSMISGFAEHGYADKSAKLFREMLSNGIRPDQTALIAILTPISFAGSLLRGEEVHAYAFRTGLVRESHLGCALVHMYSKCGNMESARRVFSMIVHKDQISCSALISAYAHTGKGRDALLLFLEMLKTNLEIDPYTVSSVLGVAASQDRTNLGNQLHALTVKFGLYHEASVGSSLVMMYSKAGNIDCSRKAFCQIIKPDLVGWTAMIVSYAQNGKGMEALELYELMRMAGIKPDSVTFVGVLSACSHAGLVEDGYYYLNSMSKDYGLEPSLRHYACMVDTLGRSGRLKEAEKFINGMPIEPDALIWGTLVAACNVHGDVEIASHAAKKVMDLKPSEDGAYISLSNIHADMGKWDEVLHIRNQMKGAGIRKEPGWSSV